MTAVISIAAAWCVAVVLIGSAALKAADRRDASASMASLGLPRWLGRRSAVLGWAAVEIVVGATLLLATGPVAQVATAVATLVCALYLGIMLRAMLRGGDASCQCFGAMSSSHVTWWSVLRNGLLLAVAVGAVPVGTEGGVPGALATGGLTAWGQAFAVAALMLAVIVVIERLPDSIGHSPAVSGATEQRSGASQPSPADPFRVPQLSRADGAPIALTDLTGGMTMFVFVSAGCGHCEHLVATLPDQVAELPFDVRYVTRSVPDRARTAFPAIADELLYDSTGLLCEQNGVHAFPAAAVYDESGERILKVARGTANIEQMVTGLGAGLQPAE